MRTKYFALLSVFLISSVLNISPAKAELQLRDGGKLVYDTEQNLTWLTDFESAGRQQTWEEATAWVASLNIDGITGWRLPTTDAAAWDGTCTYAPLPSGSICGHKPPADSSELATLYYTSLGNLGYPDAGAGLANVGPFINLSNGVYWSSTEVGDESAWVFGTWGGDQGPNPKTYLLWAVAVQDGDVAAAVPEPATYLMLLAGIAYIGYVLYRRKCAHRHGSGSRNQAHPRGLLHNFSCE